METFKDYIIRLYGEPILQASRRLQRSTTKQARHVNHLTFLKRCRDTEVIPRGLRLKTPIRSRGAHRILKDASMALVRERIRHLRSQLHQLQKEILSLQSTIKSTLSGEDWDKVERFNRKSYDFAFQTTKSRQTKKFMKLLPSSHTGHRSRHQLSHSKTVVNLSKRKLTHDEQEVLSLGLNFAVAPRQVNKKEIIQRIEPGLKHLSQTQANSIRFQVTQALASAKPPKSNISKTEKSAITNLRRDNSIHILTADKGNATVVMDRTEYEAKIQTLLASGTYRKLPKDPTPALERKVNDKLLSLRKKEALSQTLYRQLRSSSGMCPILFGQPKIHKPDIPLRPIVSTRGSPTYSLAQHLALILKPLVGNSEHHVVNSTDFIEQIRDIAIQSTDTLISFDVESLFTNVPVKDSCQIIHKRLQADETLKDRTQMSPEQILELLSVCLNSTSFKWRDTFYQQTEGAAMGSPLSPVIANLFMEHFEQTALQTATFKPKMWLRYVDDTFVVWPHGVEKVNDFLQHLNNQHPNIRFTMEVENEHQAIPFLDTLITRTAQGFLSHQVYRKPTHTDRYLNYRSFHHPSVLRSINSTLVRRAHMVSDQTHLPGELQHLRHVLECNGYPPRHIKTSLPPRRSLTQDQPKSRVILPFLGPTSQKLKRILEGVDIEVRHCSSTKLQSILSSHKDRRPTNQQPGVYQIPCECGKVYIGETGRSFAARLKEHQAHGRRDEREKSAIIHHAHTNGHRVLWDDSKLLTSVKHWHTRRVREAMEIHLHDTVPQDIGLQLSNIWLTSLNSD